MTNTFIKVFRATSGSGVVYFDETEAPPAGISNQITVGKRYNPASIPAGSVSTLLWKWNGVDTTQFDLSPVTEKNLSASLEIISSSYSPTSKSLLVSGTLAAGVTGDHIVFLSTSSLPTTNYILEMGIRSVNKEGSGYSYGGPVVLAFGSGSGFHGYSVTHVNDSYGTLELKKVLPSWIWQSGTLDPTYDTDVVGQTPLFLALDVQGGVISSSFAFSMQITSKTGDNAGHAYSKNLTNRSWNPLISTWATSPVNRFGISIVCGTPSVNPTFIIDHFLVRSHPYLP